MFKIFGRHYGTERFFIMIFGCILVMVSMFFYGGNIRRESNKKTVASTALYTNEYTWSRTGTKGSVVSLAKNSDGTKVFMLIQNTIDASDIDANRYQVYMKASEGKLLNNPKLTIYSYGNTGYVGFYFTDTRGFANQVLSIIIRNNSAASDMATANTFDPNVERDQSFVDNNQIRIYANFAASEMETLEMLDDQTFSPVKAFADTAGLIKDGTNIKSEFGNLTGHGTEGAGNIEATLVRMYEDLRNINQYHDVLIADGVRVPDLPYYIANDVIDNTPNDFEKEPSQFMTSMYGGNSTGSSGTNFDIYEEEEITVVEDKKAVEGDIVTGATYMDGENGEQPYHYLHTDYLYPGMVNFDWQGHPLSHGYISQLDFYKNGGNNVSMYSAYLDYSKWQSKYAQDTEGMTEMPQSINYQSWRKADGTYVDLTDENDIMGINADIKNYEAVLNSYLKNKQTYAQQLKMILDIEAKVQILGDKAVTTNAQPDNLQLYGER